MNQDPPITLQIKDLRPALVGLGKVIGRKATLPVLGCLHIRTGNAKARAQSALTLTGTDLDSTLELTVPAMVPAPVAPVAPFLVPLTVLQDFAKACGAHDSIALQAESGNRVTLTRLYGNTRIPRTFACPPAEEFPEIPALKGKAFKLEEEGKQSLLQALACASADSTRLILNGAYLEGGHTFVGTDGRHLYRANSMKYPVKIPVVLPCLKVLDWKWLRDTPDWMLALDGERFCLSGEHWKITAKQIEGTYPNYQQIMPRESDFRSSVTLREDTLEQVASTLQSLPGEKTPNKPVGLRTTRQGLVLLARAHGSDPHTEIPVEGAVTTGPAVTVFVNRDYLTRAFQFGLNRVDIIDELSPVRMRQGTSARRDLIMMPVRVFVPADASASASASASATTPVSAPAPSTPHPQPEPQIEPMNRNTPTTSTTPSHNGKGNHSHHPAVESEEASPLDAAANHVNSVKELLRQATSALTDLAQTLKQARNEQRNTEREVRQVRSTIRTLQKVDL
jgi:DNA polymerase III sliding clamp (beta) subunit (PCNA family)